MLRDVRVHRLALGLFLAACHPRVQAGDAPMSPDTSRIRQDVFFLASDLLEGRGTGTRGNDSAAAFIAQRFQLLGLTPPVAGFLQPFDARPAAHGNGVAASLKTHNVVGLIPGHDAALRRRYIVLGAHFDHLGRGTFGAMDATVRDSIRNGADDNASGTAAIIELARLIRARPLRRTVVVVAFSGEELGLLGSSHFVTNPPAPFATDSVVAMLNFDMVGRVRNDRLLVFGTATAVEWPAALAAANSSTQFMLSQVGDGFGPSDHSSFFARRIPVLHFFSDTHEDYHRTSDDAEKINLAGIARVVRLAEGVLREIDARDGGLTFMQAAAIPSARTASRSGPQPYLGSVPDMAAGDRPGLRLTGVTAGSPADRAGLRAGDVVVALGGRTVSDLNSYSQALYAHKPGDEVEILVMRGTQRVTFRVTLGRRGQ